MKRFELREFREKLALQYFQIEMSQSELELKSFQKTKSSNPKSRQHALYAHNARQKLLALGV
jgi:hypothetical protein